MANQIECSLVEKDLEVLLFSELIVSQPYAIAVKSVKSPLGCIRQNISSGFRSVPSALLRPGEIHFG